MSGSKSMSVHMNNLMSMLVGPVADDAEDSEEIISSEGALARIDIANKKLCEKAEANPVAERESSNDGQGTGSSSQQQLAASRDQQPAEGEGDRVGQGTGGSNQQQLAAGKADSGKQQDTQPAGSSSSSDTDGDSHSSRTSTCRCDKAGVGREKGQEMEHRKKGQINIRQWLESGQSNKRTQQGDGRQAAGKVASLQTSGLVVCGADVVGMYPALEAETTSEAIRQEVIRSRIRYENVNWPEATRYIAANSTEFETRQMGVHNLIPRRRYTKGATPGPRGPEMKSKHDTTSKQWIYRRTEYTDRERQTIQGAVMKIGVKTLFRKHVYKYGENIYRQVKGGPRERRQRSG